MPDQLWNERLRTHLPKAISIVALIVFLDHVFNLGYLNIDWIGIGLLVLVVFAPYMPNLRKLSVGDYLEMELGPKIERVKERQEDRLPEIDQNEGESGQHLDSKYDDYLYSSLEEGPVIAVSDLRSIITTILRRIAKAEELDDHDMNSMELVDLLDEEGALDRHLAESTMDVLSLSKDAIRTVDLDCDDALNILKIGRGVLSHLERVYARSAVIPTESEVVIASNEVDEYRTGEYKVKSVIPLVEDPRLVERTLDQVGLDTYLDGYEEVAEFIVEIRKID